MHCSFRRWTTCCNWRNDEEFCSQVENPEEECLAIHLCSEAQLHLNYAAGQWCETEQSTSKWLKKIKYKILEWSRQSVHLNQIEMLWHYIKWAIYARKPSSVTEFKQFWKEEWTKIPPQWCERILGLDSLFPLINEIITYKLYFVFTQVKKGAKSFHDSMFTTISSCETRPVWYLSAS